jgi:hypothetical protein
MEKSIMKMNILSYFQPKPVEPIRRVKGKIGTSKWMYKEERTTGLREENLTRKKNFGREGREIKMKSEKGRKKEKQPRRIPNPIYLVRDALVKQEEKKKRKRERKEVHRSIQTDTVDACNPEKNAQVYIVS